MEIQSINLKGKIIENNVFLAPMAGYTDYGFRKLCLNNGAGFCFTELVSAKGIVYKNKGSADLLFAGVKENQIPRNAAKTVDKPKDDKAVEVKPQDDKQVEDKPKDDKKVEDKPKDDKKVEDKPKDDKQVEDKPKDDGKKRRFFNW